MKWVLILIFGHKGPLSPEDPSLRYSCLCPRLCLSQLLHPTPTWPGPLLCPSKTQPLLPRAADPSHCILNETNRSPRSLAALDLASRPAAGPGVLRKKRVVLEVGGCLQESSLSPLWWQLPSVNPLVPLHRAENDNWKMSHCAEKFLMSFMSLNCYVLSFKFLLLLRIKNWCHLPSHRIRE